ncbi:MAG: ribosome small subunit-dependent GTPase A [Ruminococcus sp.]|nr:ribosome small subunit-dependent GTPase A [Ruminococcus sp.]
MSCAETENPAAARGRIIASVGGLYTVETSCNICTCKARGIFRKKGIIPYVGDYVNLSEDQVIYEILPRRNAILRPPVANLDQIFFVVSSCKPSPNLQLLDSFLTVTIYLKIQPILILTKVDLDDAHELYELYDHAGIPVYIVDYEKPKSIAAIGALMKNRTGMMTGNSGVGKTTLLNAIEPSLKLPVNAISEKLGRGKHTTREVRLFSCAGGYLADTPGFSTFEVEQYVKMEKERIAVCFPEFRPYLGRCRFLDCAHICEKGCAVVEAVMAGKIAQSRHTAYCNLYQIAKQRKAWEK